MSNFTEYLDALTHVCKNCNAGYMEPCRGVAEGVLHPARFLAVLRAEEDTTPR